MCFDVEEVLGQLTIQEKISLVSGVDYWHTAPVHRLNVPSIRTSDGPNGIRGQHHFNSTPTAAIPVGTALGATWNKELLYKAGQLLEKEARAKGAGVVLGPTVNIQRIPNGGRGFESFSEDPLLSGELAASYIKGIQYDGVAACIKHFVGNDQENERFSSNSIISDRALREIYLKPFEIAIEKAKPLALMTSYNKVNGVHASENKILYSILREEWGWDGTVMSDWTGTYSTSEAINAGLDLEMPGPAKFRGVLLQHALLEKTVSLRALDERVKNVLRLVHRVQASKIPERAPETERNLPEDRELLKELASEGIVLLKNEDNVLPLNRQKKVLVVGPNAPYAIYSGGGSALSTPYYYVSPLEAITSIVGDEKVVYDFGAYNHKYLPSLAQELFNGESNGTLIELFNEPPSVPGRTPFDTIQFKNINYFRMNDYTHPGLKSLRFYATLTSTFIPQHDGEYTFGIAVDGTANLYIDNELVIDNSTNQKLGESFYGSGTVEVYGKYQVKKGKSYALRIEFGSSATSNVSGNRTFSGGGGLRFGGLKIVPNPIETVLQKAKEYEQILVVTGLNHDHESEGSDRDDLKIPGESNKLIEALLEANADTVVVIQSGTPVEMPWASRVKALVHQSYGGMEGSNALADVLFGNSNPSGRLPITFPRRFEDTPSYINNTTQNGRVLYGEDIYVGYRYFDKVSRDVLFAFGHGLSYTSFELTGLVVNVNGDLLEASITARNTGQLQGSVVVQLYVGRADSKGRPVKELKAFEKRSLESGHEQLITFSVPLKTSTSYFDEEVQKWLSSAGEYNVIVGQSSDDVKSVTQAFTLHQSIVY